jgi:hypothetical protein
MDIYYAGTSSLLGTSKFHVSCSDEDMDLDTATNDVQQQVDTVFIQGIGDYDLLGLGKDCAKFAGDGKDTPPNSFVNTWLFEGMEGDGGAFDCGLPNTGIVAPVPGT